MLLMTVCRFANCQGQSIVLQLPVFSRWLLIALATFAFGAGCSQEVKPPARPAIVKGTAASGIAPAKHPPIETLARFTDVTDGSGVRFTYRDGQEAEHFTILESLGGGVALFDFDGDGALDIFLPGGGTFGPHNEIRGLPGALFHNDGACRYHDVTTSAVVEQAPFYSHGASAGDYDNDGFPDMLVTGYGGLVLFHNQGDGTFVERAQSAGLTDTLWSSSAAWGDLDGDGILDLYVAHYVNWSFDNDPVCMTGDNRQRDVCPPKKFEEHSPHTLFWRGRWNVSTDGSRAAGLEPEGQFGKGLGVLLADLDLDGHLDIYVANDTVPKFLYRNRGNGTFDEVGGRSGTAVSDTANPDGSMGLDIGDFNLDGLPDLWVANYERESLALYRNEGDCQFLHVSRSTGVTAVGSQFVSFGTLFLDFDRDGDEDVFVSNGHVIRYPVSAPVRQLPLLLENRGGRFVNVAPAATAALLTKSHLGRGAVGGRVTSTTTATSTWSSRRSTNRRRSW